MKIANEIEKQLQEFAEDPSKLNTVISFALSYVTTSGDMFTRDSPWICNIKVDRPMKVIPTGPIGDAYASSKTHYLGRDE